MTALSGKFSGLKVALCHDWLTGMRGGERVLEILCRAFPDAPVYTLIYNPSAVSDVIKSHRVVTSSLQHIPGIFSNYRRFLPLFPAVLRGVEVENVDLLISTSHCVIKGIVSPENARHLCYCFTPMRYAWLFYEEYFGANPFKKLMLKPTLALLREWDRSVCHRVDRFVTLSRHVQKRIHDFYGRDSDIVYPPVNTEYWTPCSKADVVSSETEYDLIVSALAPYKRVDLAVRAYSRSGRRLVVVGVGPDLKRLRAIAKSNIEFMGWLPDERVRELYRSCRLLVFPGEEDFGIAPVEAMACGRPVVAYACGGALETVLPDVTGVLFDEQTEDSLLRAVSRCASMQLDGSVIRAHAEKFSENVFLEGMIKCVERCMSGDVTSI